jgi:hypothetical protein
MRDLVRTLSRFQAETNVLAYDSRSALNSLLLSILFPIQSTKTATLPTTSHSLDSPQKNHREKHVKFSREKTHFSLERISKQSHVFQISIVGAWKKRAFL